MTESQTLLSEYVKHGSEPAFQDLVNRYINLVYSTAIRLTAGNSALAEDVTQNVFVDLARKASRLPEDVMLGGWLHQHTRFLASKALRGEQRRQVREREAVVMSIYEDHSEANLAQVLPILDNAIAQLGPEDRMAILLRFFEQQDLHAVGVALGSSEEAARKRVSRALEKLHIVLRRQGVSLSVAGLGTLLTAQVITAAPTTLATNVASVALSGGVVGATLPSILLRVMTVTKANAAVVGLFVILGLSVVGLHFASQRPSDSRQPLPSQMSTSGRDEAAATRQSGPTVGTFAKTRALLPRQLEDAKQALRSLLEKPWQAGSHPPPELHSLLVDFGPQWLEAPPILLERLNSPDFETRYWAVSGIWDLMINGTARDQQSFDQAMALNRPKLSAIFKDETEPVQVRRMAFQALLPSLFASPYTPSVSASLSEETAADITSVLQSSQKHSRGLQFELLDPLSDPRIATLPEYPELVRQILLPLLQQGDSNQRLLAAYGLAASQSEKSPELKNAIKDVLVRALQGNEVGSHIDLSYTYRAADGLGFLGADAKDAVPALLDFFRAAPESNRGYGQHALLAACRIDPSLRKEHPEIDLLLQQEAAAREKGNGSQRPSAATVPSNTPSHGAHFGCPSPFAGGV